jgi:antitoxin component YwqK of YwqJK toxin-antitoxin module
MSKNIRPYNTKGQRHGYWEGYHDGGLSFKCTYHNGKEVGIEEIYTYTSKIQDKIYYL